LFEEHVRLGAISVATHSKDSGIKVVQRIDVLDDGFPDGRRKQIIQIEADFDRSPPRRGG
jgi:hypothetical protein